MFRLLRVRFARLAKFYCEADCAEDLAQEACITVLEKYRTLPAQAEFYAWAQKVLKNKIGNHMRKEANRKRVLEKNPPDNADGSTRPDPELYRRLKKTLRELAETNPQQARALYLAARGEPTEQICRDLGVSRANLYVLLHRSRKWLSDRLYASEEP